MGCADLFTRRKQRDPGLLRGCGCGTYRTEDNGITEGYSYGSGGFKIAVPAGFVDSLVTLDDDGSRNQAFPGPWTVTAGQETDVSAGGGTVGAGYAVITPSTLSGGVSHSFAYSLFGQLSHTIAIAHLVIPHSWSWSRSVTDISAEGNGTPVIGISGDTIIVSGLAISGGDSAPACCR